MFLLNDTFWWVSKIRLYFAGAENSEWRKFLAEEDINDVSMSFVKLCDRVKFARPWTIADHFSADTNVLLDAGGYSYNKPDAEVTEEDAMDMANRYMAFVAENIDDVELVTEFDANILGQDWLEAMREDFYDDLPEDKFIPIWHAASGQEGLERLASRYPRVGILQMGLDDHSIPILNGLVNQYGVKLHGLGMTSMDLVKAIKWDSVGSKSWISPSIYGDTILWTGHELKRYPKKYKEQSRKRHRSYIDQQGFDAQLIIDDDRKEVLRLSVWSWQQFMASLDHQRVMQPFGVTPRPDIESGENEERDPDEVAPLHPGTGNGSLVPARRELKLLPILGITTVTTQDEDGEDVEEHLMKGSSQSLLRCDNCEIRDMCTEFSAGSECAFEFPAYVSTKNQMRALQDWLIELQTQRVQRMSMIEQIKGGYADANLSGETDRLQRMINAKREAEKSGFTLHVEAHNNGEAGAISRLFGRDVADAASVLDRPVLTAQVMDDSGIVEAEIVDEGNNSA